MYDDDVLGGNDLMGECRVDITKLTPGSVFTEWYDLVPPQHKASTELTTKYNALPDKLGKVQVSAARSRPVSNPHPHLSHSPNPDLCPNPQPNPKHATSQTKASRAELLQLTLTLTLTHARQQRPTARRLPSVVAGALWEQLYPARQRVGGHLHRWSLQGLDESGNLPT